MFVESPHQRDRTATASPPQGIVPQVVHTNAFRVNRNSAPRIAALPEMATVVLILDEERKVEYINDSGLPLFPLEDPIGCTLPALFMSSAVSGGDHIFGTLDTGNDPTTRLQLSDGRLLDCTLRTLSSGGFVLSLDDVTAYVRNAEQAERDALTGLFNRKAFRDRLKERLACEPICAFPTAILYLDLDRFKAVNDTLGHLVGDTLLKKVAQRFKSALREGDMLARLGGDEFAIIQSNVQQPAAAIALATRLIDLIGRAYAIDGHILHIGASVGIALSPDDGVEPNVLLRNADLALYRAKEEGRSCYRFFEVGMNERMQSRRTMEIDLRRALAFKELQLEYQPQIDLATNAVAGFEALIRWRHPDRGLVQPSEFIPLAEEIGVIVPIGEWVLRTACNQAAEWPSHISLAVNLSPVQFRQGKILETVVSALTQSGLSPERLELEITEGALLEDADVVIDVLNKLRDLGVRISMDDFGTGYSSISYLQKFPFDAIKIDQCFVRDIDTRTDRKAIVGAIIGLAQALGMKTIAEGVETEAELSCIRVAGCDMVQGFLTGRPLSAAASVAVLQPII